MIALTFELQLQEPLLASTLAGDPNTSVSLPFVPGSAIRGALIAHYLSQHPTRDAAVDETCRRLFFDGATRFLHAYPLTRMANRSLPTPQAWKIEKGTMAPIYDLSIETADLDQPKQIGAPFVWLDGNKVELYEPDRQINVHMQRNRQMGRATKDAGAVFQYEAIAPGEAFGSVIICTSEEDAKILKPLLEQEYLSLGGSRSAGYGRVEISSPEIDPNWSETEKSNQDISTQDIFSITLLSDAIVRDGRGQHTAQIGADTWSSLLGVRVAIVPEKTFVQRTVVGGFNRTWGLPLPQTQAVRAGSVYTIRSAGDVSDHRIERLIVEGIGERKEEGFGRLTINWHDQYEVLTPSDVPEIATLGGTEALSDTSIRLAHTMSARMLQRVLERQLVEQVNHLHLVGNIENSQLARLRVIVRNALASHDVDRIVKYLESAEEREVSKQFEGASIEGKSLPKWLKARLADSPEQVWNRLGLTQGDLPSVGGVKADWTEELACEYTMRLIDAVLTKTLDERRAQ